MLSKIYLQLRRIWLKLLVWLATMSPLSAQVTNDLSDIEFQHISKGLSQNTLTCILQDHIGFMWFGTRNGLNKYDGVVFSQYQRRFSDSITVSHGFVNCIYEDKDNSLWVGTREGGLNWYHRQRDEFISFELEEDPIGLQHSSVTAVYEDSKGNFWVGTQDKGLVLLDRETQRYRQHYTHSEQDPYSLSDDQIEEIFEDAQGNLWIVSRYHGLNLFDGQHNRFYRYGHNPEEPNSISSNAIRDVLVGRDGNTWIATQDGLNLMYRDPINRVLFKHFKHDIQDSSSISYNVVVCLEEDDFGNIWVGSENGGLSIYDPRSDRFTRYYHNPRDPASVGSNSFWCIYKDRSGIMWLGPLNSGINKYDPYRLQFSRHTVKPYLVNTLSHSNVTCFLEDPSGNLWIGTDGGGLNYYDRETNSYTHYKHDPQDPGSIGSNAVLSLLYDMEGRLWVGTWEGGLNLFHPQSGTFTRFIHDEGQPGSISTNNIFTMLLDSSGRFWVGATAGALELFDPKLGSFTHYRDENFPGNSSIYKIFEDNNGEIWMGSEQGLTLLSSPGEPNWDMQHYTYKFGSSNGLTAKGVINIFEDSQGRFWIGTEGGGLNLFDRDKEEFKAYTQEDGLPNDVIYGILEDDKGFIWISTNKGLSKFDPVLETFRNYDHSDGLQADEFIRGAYYKTRDGQFIFGGIAGYNTFYPEDIVNPRSVSAVIFTDFQINNQSVKSTDQDSPLSGHINDVQRIVLSHDQSVFGFDFVSLDYSQGAKISYRYQLENFDRNWQDVGNISKASYSNVPPGDYLFKVSASNNEVDWSDVNSIVIHINPPWWKSTGAYLTYSLLIAGLLLWGRQSIINRERLKSNLKLEHLELTKMQELDQMKSRFFTNISHEFRTPLTLIKEPLMAMYRGEYAGDTKNQFRVMLRNTQKLLRLINQLLDLSKLGVGNLKLRASHSDLNKFLNIVAESFKNQAQKQCIDFAYRGTDSPLMAYFDPVKLEDIVCNLLSNAFKFTPEYGSVTLSLSLEESTPSPGSRVVITVKDSGIGIPEDQLEIVFQRFYQVENRQHSTVKGTGIGLALTKELVELHHGEIQVTSRPDQGSEFRVYLPLGSDHLRPDEIIADSQVEVTEFGELKGLHQDQNIPEKDLQTPLPQILVVEDNHDMRAYITEYLETNHRILEAANGKEAFEMALQYQPELIISDIKMPIMDGLDLCKKIKEDPRVSHIPVALLTGKVDEEQKIESMQEGADYYFTKPFNSKLLQIQVNNIIQSRQAIRNYFSGDKKLYLKPSEVQLGSSDQTFLKNALTVVEENMSNPEFTVIEFGKELGLSRMKLYRKLKSITGQSANEFIRAIRLQRAAQLIEQDQMTIAEITYEVGFNDLQYFRECFKKHFGVTPSKYSTNPDQNR